MRLGKDHVPVHRRTLKGTTFVFLLLALSIAAAWPCFPAAGVEVPVDLSRNPAAESDFGEELGRTRPYYAPEVSGTSSAVEEEAIKRMSQSVPAGLLPESLLPEEESAPGATEGDFEAAGAGGWTPLTRPYLPSGAPTVTYSSRSTNQVLDNSGRVHAIYGREDLADISQPPDGAGFRLAPLQNLYYATFYEGAWNVPMNLTNLSGLGDSELIYYAADADSNFHVIYSTWVWGRDASRPAGEYTAYQHEEETLWYRYMSPDGMWSAPRPLTGFSGSWGLLGADFTMQGNSLYGTFVMVRNNETTPSSFRTQVGFVEGYLDTWGPVWQLDTWYYTDDPGQRQPALWPNIDVSDLGGEVTVVYGTFTVPGPLYTAKLDVYGCVRDSGGTWSGHQKITNAANNEEWLPVLAIYKSGSNDALVLAFKLTIVQDATHPPHEDTYLIYHRGGAWEAPTNVTHVADQQDAALTNINLDSSGNIHFFYAVFRYIWTGGPEWQPQGAGLKYTCETEAGMSTPVNILSYLFQRYPNEADMALDSDDNVHLLFSTLMTDGFSFWNQNIGYATNAPAGDPNAFSPPMMIRPSTTYWIYNLTASAFPDGDILASWFEKGFDGGGNPTYGRMYSRYRDGTAWRDTVIVSSIPGNTDNLHVIQPSWPSYEDTNRSDTGEQQVVFETAKYDVPTTAYYDFRKYFTETVNGEWTTPQLISGSTVAGERPALYVDGGQRYFVLYSATDTATGKEVLYATQQRDPTPPASTYFFAEGTTRSGFAEWLCLQNPGEEQANVTITYMLETGANIDQPVPVPAHSRVTVSVNAAAGLQHDVSARVTSDKFIVAERPMYFDYRGWTGGHCVMGALNTSRLWYFAEGATLGGFEEYLTLQNPSDENAHVDITYVLGDGTTRPGNIDIGPRSRDTINVNSAIGPGQEVSLVVRSDTAIVCERPMYFNYRGSTGGHCEMGSTSLANRWYFAEGTTRSGFDTYICLQNPYAVDAEASLTFILEDGSTVVEILAVPATSRRTLRVNDVVGPERDVSTVVESASLLLAERPMYFNYEGSWPGGHVATGARSPKNTWFFAEGTTRAGFDEWLSLQNPCDVDATATLSFMLEDGTVQTVYEPVPAHTRVTVAVWPIVGPNHDVSVVVSSDRAIVAERPSYFLYEGRWPGGHVVVGL
jgi:hypothetical protein